MLCCHSDEYLVFLRCISQFVTTVRFSVEMVKNVQPVLLGTKIFPLNRTVFRRNFFTY